MDRLHMLPQDADLAAIRLERVGAVLEAVLVFSIFYLVQQWLAARGFFERAMEFPGAIGTITTHQGWIVATLLGLFLLPVVFRRLNDGWRFADFGFRRQREGYDLLLAAYLGIAMGLWFTLGFWIRSAAFEDARSLLSITTWSEAYFYVGYVALVTSAIRNEFFFRGYVQNLLTGEFGTAWGTLLALTFFCVSLHWIGLTHVFAILLPLGLGAALLFNRGRSIWAPLLFHGLALGLGFLGYALLELTPRGYALYTSGLALLTLGLAWRMRLALRGLLRDTRDLLLGLESSWLGNGAILLGMVGLLLILEYTSHADLRVHAVFTSVLALVYLADKTGLRIFRLKRLLGS